MQTIVRPILLVISALALKLGAQTPLPSDTPVHGAPNGPEIGSLRRGAPVRVGNNQNGWTPVTIEGWIVSSRVSARKDTLDRTITGTGNATLRTADGMGMPVVGELEPGTILKRLSDRNGWTQVRRSAWIKSAALQAPAPVAKGRGNGERGRATGNGERATGSGGRATANGEKGTGSATVDSATQRTTRTTSLRSAPNGSERASVKPGATVETLAHEAGWARVRIEGWVPERDLMIADSSAEMSLSAADLRADPAAHKGKTVRWDVQVIAVQRADALRRALAPEEPYLLARGPGDEGAVLYIAIPRTLLEKVQALPQLSTVTITARVRDGRSAPVGAPLLDLISISKAQ